MKRTLLAGSLVLSGLAMAGCGASGGDPQLTGARLSASQGDYAAALTAVDASLRANPGNPDALELKADILAQQAARTDDLQRSVSLARTSADTYRQLLQTPAKAEAARDGLGRLYGTFYSRGANLFNRGAQNPDSTQLFSQAYDYFSTASVIAPDSAAAYQVAGYSLFRAGRTDEAITQLRQATERGIDEAQPYVLLGQIYLQKAETEASMANEAITVLENGAQRFPQDSDIQLQLLRAYQKAGRADQAMAGFASRVQADPTNATLRMAYGTMLLNAERYDEAIQQLNEAARLTPNDADASYNLGAAYTNLAASVNRQLNEKEDAFSRDRARLSTADRSTRQNEIDALKNRRNELFRLAATPLAQARTLYEQQGKDTRSVCSALFQAYTYSGQTAQAASVRTCAGF